MPAHLPPTIAKEIEASLGLRVQNFSGIIGGCINQGGRLKTSDGDFFLKWNDAKKFPGMFAAEARGLKILQQPRAIRIPDVIYVTEATPYQFILLEWIEQRSRLNTYWTTLGSQLATLHRHSCATFGLDHDNYIGSLLQCNQPATNWIDFFIRHRLQAQLQLGERKGLASVSLQNNFEKLFAKLHSILPEEKPSLIHGDLWSGNLITDHDGKPCLIDPAVYFGCRETEIAMTQLFGGFGSEFLESYYETFPLLPQFEERLELYKLYPLLVHVNLFGLGYLPQVVSILKRFV
ncbi:MAG: fructosamine kinase family protein [Bacteroidota bacterium]